MKILEYQSGSSSHRDKKGAKRKPLIIHLALKPCSGTPYCIEAPGLPSPFITQTSVNILLNLIQPRYYRIGLVIGLLPFGFDIESGGQFFNVMFASPKCAVGLEGFRESDRAI